MTKFPSAKILLFYYLNAYIYRFYRFLMYRTMEFFRFLILILMEFLKFLISMKRGLYSAKILLFYYLNSYISRFYGFLWYLLRVLILIKRVVQLCMFFVRLFISFVRLCIWYFSHLFYDINYSISLYIMQGKHRYLLKNPYFFFSLFIPLMILVCSPSFGTFLKVLIINLSFFSIEFGYLRTREPFFWIEVELMETKWFTCYHEVRGYTNIVSFVSGFGIPFFSCLLSTYLFNL